MIINHKLLTVKRTSLLKGLIGSLVTPALKVLWKTTTRPFSEELAIVCSPAEEKNLQRNYSKVVEPLVEAKDQLLVALATIHKKDQPLKELFEQILEKMRLGLEEKNSGKITGGLGFQLLSKYSN